MEKRREAKWVISKLSVFMVVMVMVGFFVTGRNKVHADSYHDYYIYDTSMIKALNNWNTDSYSLSFQQGENIEATTKTSSGKTVYGIASTLTKGYNYGIRIHYGSRTQEWSRRIYLCDTTIDDSQLSYIRTGEYSFVIIVGNSKLTVSNGRKSYSKPAQYTCTFDTNGVGRAKAYSFVEGRVINLADYKPESKFHLLFDGWYSDPQFTRRVNYVSLRKSITLYAKWIIPVKVRGLRVKTPMETMKISWKRNNKVFKKYGISGYEVRVTATDNFAYILFDRCFRKGKTSCTMAMAPGAYCVWIRYYRGTAVSEWTSKTVIVHPFYKPVTESKPPRLKKVKTEKNKVIVSWKKPADKTVKAYSIYGYEIQYSTDPEFTTDVRSKTVRRKRTSFKFKGQKKIRYYIRIRYIGAAGAGPWSGSKTVKIKK